MTTAEFVAHWEGFRECAYHDVAGYPTIGYGRKLSNVRWTDLSQFPDTTKEAEADHLLIPKFKAGVERIITMRLEPDEETALVSFAYNLGLGSLAKLEPFVAEYQRTGGGLKLMLEWLDWCKATIGGRKQVVEGLLNRRRAEVALFFGV